MIRHALQAGSRGAQRIRHLKAAAGRADFRETLDQLRQARCAKSGLAAFARLHLQRGCGLQTGNTHDGHIGEARGVLTQQATIFVNDRPPVTQVFVDFGDCYQHRVNLSADAREKAQFRTCDGRGGIAGHQQDGCVGSRRCGQPQMIGVKTSDTRCVDDDQAGQERVRYDHLGTDG